MDAKNIPCATTTLMEMFRWENLATDTGNVKEDIHDFNAQSVQEKGISTLKAREASVELIGNLLIQSCSNVKRWKSSFTDDSAFISRNPCSGDCILSMKATQHVAFGLLAYFCMEQELCDQNRDPRRGSVNNWLFKALLLMHSLRCVVPPTEDCDVPSTIPPPPQEEEEENIPKGRENKGNQQQEFLNLPPGAIPAGKGRPRN
nr:unnamed protein product [Callosobruchus analis]